ncbi:DNA-processing protein DprA [Marinobacter confluentis]|uniref:DNA-protecting protein DprA n=1 Tax=Marinobacter confluentis TaxID=1697557 RepID=A0A4Z1BY51_9GAMM|nr:DNA-processing protein DprA [Marinobacter confluentis]TGN39450.1 DNA-protecting protein DprA [Marinobacter confluentis]
MPSLSAATDAQLLGSQTGFWLLVSCLPKFGRKRQQAVQERLGDLSRLADCNSATLRAIGLQAETISAIEAWQSGHASHPLVAKALAIYRDCQHHQIDLMTRADSDYPESLRHIHDAPLVLYLKGDRALIGQPQVGIVGSRNASRAGLEHARAFAAALGQRGLLVTSGLALGVDGAAHAGALDAGFPTIAVIGNGIDQPYPYRHRALASRVVANGLLVSEYPPGTDARPAHFPQRNRIISGLGRGILVVEAGLKSGSLITARLALEQGREVFAIPGSIHNPMARGCHELIRQGAVLVETVDDIFNEFESGWSSIVPESVSGGSATSGLEPREIAVLDALGYDPQSTDDLCSITGLPADQLMQSLLLLELQGLVDSAPGGFQRIA